MQYQWSGDFDPVPPPGVPTWRAKKGLGEEPHLAAGGLCVPNFPRPREKAQPLVYERELKKWVA